MKKFVSMLKKFINNRSDARKAMQDNEEKSASEIADFEAYRIRIIHQWLRTLTILGFTLVPFFFILDYITVPPGMLKIFAFLRIFSVVLIVVQYFVIRFTRPGRFSYLHGYLFSINVGGVICYMTYLLGGFESSYYAGVNLVMIAVNMLLPWKPIHSAINSIIMIAMYVGINLVFGKTYDFVSGLNHFFFMGGTAVISVSINLVKNKLEKSEFFLRANLKKIRDALWGEMELAKHIQTALLPGEDEIKSIGSPGKGLYSVAAAMLPAEEVGGDYYDIIENHAGEKWVAIGDVTGHGVESGLIMMMVQTSICSLLNNTSGYKPSSILSAINGTIKKNISRLKVDRYMGMSLFSLHQTHMIVAGKHQDIIMYRAATNSIEVIQSLGTWIGIVDSIKAYTTDMTIPVAVGDIMLLFTDGVTEAADKNGAMYGQKKLIENFKRLANQPVKEILASLLEDVHEFWDYQDDDVTMVLVKRYE